MKIESSVVRKIGWLIVGLLVLFLAWCSSGATKSPQPNSPAPLLIPHDSSAPYGGVGGVPARMLADLLGDLHLSYRVVPVEGGRAGGLSSARAAFDLGTPGETPLPAAAPREVMALTRAVCWFNDHPFFDLDCRRNLAQGTKGLGDSRVPLPAAIE